MQVQRVIIQLPFSNPVIWSKDGRSLVGKRHRFEGTCYINLQNLKQHVLPKRRYLCQATRDQEVTVLTYSGGL